MILQFAFLCAFFLECKSCPPAPPPWKSFNYMPQNGRRPEYFSRKSTKNCGKLIQKKKKNYIQIALFLADFPELFRRQSHFEKVMNGFSTENPLPYQIYIEIEYLKNSVGFTVRCGGTLIAPNLVLSAHHCFAGVKMDKITVFGNLYDLNFTYPRTRYQVNKVSRF